MRRRKDSWAWGQLLETFSTFARFLSDVHRGQLYFAKMDHEDMLSLPEFE